MIVSTILDEYKLISQVLYKRNMLNIGLGSVSLKLEDDKMIINKKNKTFLEDDFFTIVHINKKELSWNEASEDIKIHAKIYKTISYAKTILNVFPVNTISYSLNHTFFKPIDLQGKKILEKVKIVDMENEENIDFIVTKNLKERSILIIRGYGVFIIARDIKDALKKAIILENSTTILLNTTH